MMTVAIFLRSVIFGVLKSLYVLSCAYKLFPRCIYLCPFPFKTVKGELTEVQCRHLYSHVTPPTIQSKDKHKREELADSSDMEDLAEHEQFGQINPSDLVPKRHSSSVVWKYFGFDKDDAEQKNTKCKVCLKTVATHQGNTTNLFHHLQHNHAVEFEDVQKAQTEKQGSRRGTTRQQYINEAFAGQTPYDRKSKRWIELTNAIGYHIAKDMAPLATVERTGFKRLMNTADKRYTIPSRKYFSQTVLPNMFNTEREKVAAELKQVKHFAATSDMWSSRTMDPYISLTVHFIDEWKLHTRVLETAYFPNEHTGEMIAQGLRLMLLAWDLKEENLVAITTDNGANVVKATELNHWRREQCFGHRLHLAIGKCAHLMGMF